MKSKKTKKTIIKYCKSIIALFAVLTLTTSCGIFNSLTSNTTIKPNESFVLGNNEHGTFKVKLKNASNHDLKIIMAPITGGTHSPIIVKPNETISVQASRYSCLKINQMKLHQSISTLQEILD
jgi:hypothetical protein